MLKEIPKKLKNLDFTGISDQEILEHFNYRCQVDGSTFEVANHHLVFKSQGGVNGPRIPLCNSCHGRLHSNADFRKKWELKLFKIAAVFWVLRKQGIVF
jgi:hypothetical protein